MPTIVAMNPGGKRKKPAKKRTTKKTHSKRKVPTMARKKGRKRAAPKKRRRRRNPSSKRRGRARSYARSTIGGVNFQGAIKATIPLLFGAVAAKFAAKRFAEGGGEMDDWSWKNYLLALTGGLVAAIATSALIKGRGNLAQKIFEGSMLLVGYKIFTTELAPKNPTLSSWFSGYGQIPEGNEYGDIWRGDDADYMTGADNFYRPLDESHRTPEAAGLGQIVPATATMGDEVVPATPVMGGLGQDVDISPSARSISSEFESAYR